MEKPVPTESLIQYYERTGQIVPAELLQLPAGVAHFNVTHVSCRTRKSPFNRRDYYKICLSIGSGEGGKGMLMYNDQEIQLPQPCIIFTNPSVPASIEISYPVADRYSVFFNRQFVDGLIPPDVQYASPLFNAALHPVVALTEEEFVRLSVFFREMQSLQESDYAFKKDMIRSVLQLLVHEGIRLQQKQFAQPVIARDRLVHDFFALLDLQFPIDPDNALKLLTPAYFADQLHVHINHLNSVVKKHSGKTTRTIIHERVVTEARALLRNTNWNIAEVGYALGFEYPSHFNKYFKQFAGVSPQEFRLQHQVATSRI